MGDVFKKGQVWECYKFARDMIGNHNPDMIMARQDWEIFRDDFRGKLGEVAFKNYLQDHAKSAKVTMDIDYSVTGRGSWDFGDLGVNNRQISIKSVKRNSRFLMIETFRFDEYGNYTYKNNDDQSIKIDAYVLVSVDIFPEIGKDDMDYKNIREFWNSKGGRKISAEILGAITHEKFWEIKHFAPKGMRCNLENLTKVCNGELPDLSVRNGKTENLQKDNYIIDSKNEMIPISDLIKLYEK